MKRIIVTRFSAMGDVAMVASVLQEFQSQHKDTEIIMVSRAFFKPFFDHIPRTIFHAIEPQSQHKGFLGLLRLARELTQYQAQYFADLHNNIRTRTLRLLFTFSRLKIAFQDKGRDEKKALTRQKNKVFKQLKLTVERYADVFRTLGFPINLSHKLKKSSNKIPSTYQDLFMSNKRNIGVAPFAQHSFKVFPIHKMEDVISDLSRETGLNIFIFGGGKKEKDIANQWAKKFPNTINTIGQLSLAQELDLISNLDIMISMDSSGMHMASLVGTRCLSIWGATHPYAGFLGYGQSYSDCIQVEHPNRPNSIYGNIPCDCDGIEAIDLVTPQMVTNKVLGELNKDE